MRYVFFDIETTDLHFVGQILDYAFVEVDDNWQVVSTLRGKIKISRTQLPSPGAIIATQTDIIKHNEEAEDLEHVAMAKIFKYLQGIVERQDTKLIGYNSSKFDLPYLRTCFIRNGLNPYFGGAIKYGDLIHVVQRLVASNPDFYEKLEKKISGKPSTKLESVCKTFGLLDSAQLHESYADVLLTIDLAKFLATNYKIDVRTYSAYEPTLATFYKPTNVLLPNIENKLVVVRSYPFINHENVADHDDYSYYVMLEQNKAQALWINIKEYEEGKHRDAVYWYNKNTSSLFVKEYVKDPAWLSRAKDAFVNLFDVSLNNFWPPKSCDIEQFIYMLPMTEIDAVYDAIWRNDLTLMKQTKSKYGSQLYLRHLCNVAPLETVENPLKQFILYKYGGQLKLGKDHLAKEYQDAYEYFPTYTMLLEQIDKHAENPEHAHIMNQLKTFYKQSIISKLMEG